METTFAPLSSTTLPVLAGERWHPPLLEHTVPGDIVVADDEVSIARVIADLLGEEGYSVRVFHDGASALQAILERPPLLVLLDIAMPVMSGDKVLATLRRHGLVHLPVVLMSANTSLSDFLACGATEVIPKPFELDNVLTCIETYAQPHEQPV